MDGSMSYARGGQGIFTHQTGPYAGPTPVRNVRIQGDGRIGPDFAGLGFGEVEAGTTTVSPTVALTASQIGEIVGRDVATKGFPWTTEKTAGALAVLATWPTWKKIAVGGGIALFAGALILLVARKD